MNPQIIKLLVNAGAPLTYTNKDGITVDLLTLAVDQAVKDYRYLNNLKELLQTSYFIMNIKMATEALTQQFNRLGIALTQLTDFPNNKTKINNITNAMTLLGNRKKELADSARVKAEMDAEEQNYNWGDLNR